MTSDSLCSQLANVRVILPFRPMNPRVGALVTLIPAHNEAAYITRTLNCLKVSRVRSNRVIVIADNCSDSTAELARLEGAEVFVTVNNRGRKAGALNQALDWLLPTLNDADLILAMDAEIAVAPDFIFNAIRHFETHRARYGKAPLGAVSANFGFTYSGVLAGRSSGVEIMQSMQAERDRRYTGRKQGRVGCMSGGGSVFRVSALRAVRQAYGQVYFHNTMTEDWMLTFALKHQGYKLLKPQDCVISTAAVPTWKALFTQRQRWSHGYVETLSHFGWTRHTVAPKLGNGYWLLALLIWLGWVGLMSVMLIHGQAFHFQSWVLAITFLLLFAKVLTVRRLGRRAMVIASTMLPELVFGWWLTSATVWGLTKHVIGINGKWGGE